MIPDFDRKPIQPTTSLDDAESLAAWEEAELLSPYHAAWTHLEKRMLFADLIRQEDLVRVVSVAQASKLQSMFPNVRAGDMLLQTTGSLGWVRGLRRVSVHADGKWVKLAPRKRDPKHEVTMGRVMANKKAREMLSGLTRDYPKVFVIVEGEPDFLTWASIAPEAAVIGITSGCWNLEIAAFIPPSVPVLLMTDKDPVGVTGIMGAGDRYAHEIGRSLTRHKLFRYRGVPRSDGKMHDQNSLLCACELTKLEDVKPLIHKFTPEDERKPEPIRVAYRRPITDQSQAKRIATWEKKLDDLVADLAAGVYNGNRWGAMEAIGPIGLASKDGLLNGQEAARRIEAAYLSGAKKDQLADRKAIIKRAFG